MHIKNEYLATYFLFEALSYRPFPPYIYSFDQSKLRIVSVLYIRASYSATSCKIRLHVHHLKFSQVHACCDTDAVLRIGLHVYIVYRNVIYDVRYYDIHKL